MVITAIPWVMFFAARNLFGEEPLVRIVPSLAAFLGTAYWWNSLPREMFFYGVVGFPPAAYLSLLAVSLFYRILNSERLLTVTRALWLVVAVAILPLHFQAVLILAPPMIALLMTQREFLHRRGLLWIGAAIVAAVLANLVWLLPAITHRADEVSSTIVGQLPLFSSSDPLTFVKDYFSQSGYWTFRPSAWEKGWDGNIQADPGRQEGSRSYVERRCWDPFSRHLLRIVHPVTKGLAAFAIQSPLRSLPGSGRLFPDQHVEVVPSTRA